MDHPQFKSLDLMMTGTIFLRLNGEERILGIITLCDAGDRGPGYVTWVLENGHRGKTVGDHSNEKAFVLGVASEIGTNPLRTLLNWAGNFGG